MEECLRFSVLLVSTGTDGIFGLIINYIDFFLFHQICVIIVDFIYLSFLNFTLQHY